MPDTPYDKQTWRDIDIEALVGHAHDSVNLLERHYKDDDMEAFAATLAQVRDQVDVLHDRQDELKARIEERQAPAPPPEMLPLLPQPGAADAEVAQPTS